MDEFNQGPALLLTFDVIVCEFLKPLSRFGNDRFFIKNGKLAFPA